MELEFLNGLNERQREAVEATEGRIRVVAGAGSGKTKALTCRYAYLVNVLGVDPANILCLTFTNKAAQEMRQRISGMVDSGNTNDYVCTIHGFCVKFLRKEIHRLGYPKSFTILDDEDCKMIAKQVMQETGSDRTVETVGQFLAALADRKVREFLQQPNYIDNYFLSNLVTKGQEDDLTNGKDTLPLREGRGGSFGRFLSLQQKTFGLDFQDLIFFTIHIMKRFPEATKAWQQEMQYIMLDEAQDCNKSDWTIVETLAEIHQNLFIVGDPDQAIYEWRGARPDLFINFRCDQQIVLDQNYRSTTPILQVANSVISRNKKRVKKDLYTLKSGGTTVTHFHGRSDDEECEWIALKIEEMLKQDGVAANDFAILYRASYLSRAIEQRLMKHNIDYVIWGGTRFFDRAEIKDALSYLRLIDTGDDLSFQRIANVPSRKIGRVFMDRLRLQAEADNTTMYEALKSHISSKNFYRESVVDFISLIEECRQMRDAMMEAQQREQNPNKVFHVVSDILDHVLDKSGMKQMLRDDEDTDRLENLEELLQSVKLYEDAHVQDEISITQYLQDIALYTNADYRKDAAKVRLMTIHQAKGLEFPFVFVIGLSEGVMPSMKTLRERKRDGEEEERRLMYVAITRAEHQLFLTESEGFSAVARLSKYPSRFLKEIKRELFVTEGDMDEMLWKSSQEMMRNLGLDFAETEEKETYEGTVPEKNESTFAPGTIVLHQLLGEGVIQGYNEARGSYEVRFTNGSIRNIRADFLQKKS